MILALTTMKMQIEHVPNNMHPLDKFPYNSLPFFISLGSSKCKKFWGVLCGTTMYMSA